MALSCFSSKLEHMFQFSDKCLEWVQEHKFQPEQATGVCHLDPDQGAANVWKEITWFKTELAKTYKMEEYYFIRVYNSLEFHAQRCMPWFVLKKIKRSRSSENNFHHHYTKPVQLIVYSVWISLESQMVPSVPHNYISEWKHKIRNLQYKREFFF